MHASVRLLVGYFLLHTPTTANKKSEISADFFPDQKEVLVTQKKRKWHASGIMDRSISRTGRRQEKWRKLRSRRTSKTAKCAEWNEPLNGVRETALSWKGCTYTRERERESERGDTIHKAAITMCARGRKRTGQDLSEVGAPAYRSIYILACIFSSV